MSDRTLLILTLEHRITGILTVAVVTRPFRFEGAHRMRLAEEGIRRLQDSVDTLIVIPNQNLFKMVDQSTTLIDAFRYLVCLSHHFGLCPHEGQGREIVVFGGG
jgi:cell division GTPase FtsZ